MFETLTITYEGINTFVGLGDGLKAEVAKLLANRSLEVIVLSHTKT